MSVRKPFVILDAEILSSSVWSEAAHVRLVWITLLIMCDTDGYVGASVPGVARAAGVSLEEAEDALRRFQEPDPYSRTQTHEGRRVELAERGWRVLNFEAHIDRLSGERKRSRDRVRRHRAKREARIKADQETRRNACNATDGDGNVTVAQGIGNSEQGAGTIPLKDSVASAPAQLRLTPTGPKLRPVAESWSREACDDWIARFGGTAPGGQIGKALKPLVEKHGWATVRKAWADYLTRSEGEFVSPSRFAATYGEWAPKPEPPRPEPKPAPWERYQ